MTTSGVSAGSSNIALKRLELGGPSSTVAAAPESGPRPESSAATSAETLCRGCRRKSSAFSQNTATDAQRPPSVFSAGSYVS